VDGIVGLDVIGPLAADEDRLRGSRNADRRPLLAVVASSLSSRVSETLCRWLREDDCSPAAEDWGPAAGTLCRGRPPLVRSDAAPPTSPTSGTCQHRKNTSTSEDQSTLWSHTTNKHVFSEHQNWTHDRLATNCAKFAGQKQKADDKCSINNNIHYDSINKW